MPVRDTLKRLLMNNIWLFEFTFIVDRAISIADARTSGSRTKSTNSLVNPEQEQELMKVNNNLGFN